MTVGRWQTPPTVAVALCVAIACVGGPLQLRVATASATKSPGFCTRHMTVNSGPSAKRGFAAHLITGSRSVVAGHRLWVRIVNAGTDALDFGSASRVQRWEGGSWVRMAVPERGVPGLLSFGLLPRSVSNCVGSITSPEWPNGRYRLVLEVTAIGSDNRSHRHYLHTVFSLTADRQ